eukprot:TRINITY_DN18286_c0_g1_i1.p1 TRINITY_DN18286_c0_g1~~TRINITY_DN18286_c0_g1_i1.p1  ORF type:complete len:100 (+),score=4.81 TRINITY_DN18286_c0_g1_i1:312-611(+)
MIGWGFKKEAKEEELKNCTRKYSDIARLFRIDRGGRLLPGKSEAQRYYPTSRKDGLCMDAAYGISLQTRNDIKRGQSHVCGECSTVPFMLPSIHMFNEK